MSKTLVGDVLLVVESSDAAVRAARYGIALARQLASNVHAAFVVDTDTLRQLLTGRILVREEMEELETDLAQQGRKYLRMVEELGNEAGIKVQTHLLKGTWSQSVLGTAREVKADLLVMGGFTYSMTKRDLVSKQKQLVVDDAPCPVLFVR